jgi:hypothetical protein
MRIVSLVPSATETLVALGRPPIACTRFCDFDDAAKVGGTKNPDVGEIVALAPDLVVVNDEENRLEDAQALERAGCALHSMSPRSVVDVGPAVVALCEVVRVEVPVPFGTWNGWVAATTREECARAFIATWRRPYMTLNGDTYGSSLLALLGIKNVYADAPERYPEVTLDDVAARAPDTAVLPDEPYAFSERHVPEVERALPGARVVVADGRDVFWWGIRTPKAARRLAGLL